MGEGTPGIDWSALFLVLFLIPGAGLDILKFYVGLRSAGDSIVLPVLTEWPGKVPSHLMRGLKSNGPKTYAKKNQTIVLCLKNRFIDK
jgi:hypothetical protein